jgi:acetyl esterase/lipase
MHSGFALLMDVYRPAKPNGYGVLFIHGSGWGAPEGADAPQLKDGDQTRLYGGALVRAGYTVFAINHRAAPRFRYPAPIEDAQRAVRFIRAEAKRFGIDRDRLGAVGSSSGGHLVSMLGVLDGAGDAQSKSAVERASARVQAVVAHAPPTEMLSLGSDGRKPIPLYGYGVPTDKHSTEYRDYVAGSPVTHVTPDDAPFLLLHSDDDRKVPISQSELFAAALKKANVPVKLVRVAGGGHSPSFAGAKNPPDYLGETVRWLDQYLRQPAGVTKK